MEKQRRSLFDMIFGRRKEPPETTTLKPLNGYTPVFYPFGDNSYNSDVVRAAVDAIARNGAKLKAKHIRRIDGKISEQNSSIQRLLQVRPNPYMNAYDFFYKVITILYMQNNSFVYVDIDDAGNVVGLYPVPYARVEMRETRDKKLFAKFDFFNGQNVTLPYESLIHLRRFFYRDDIYGEIDDKALKLTLELLNVTDQGIINAIKSSASLRGILKFTQAMLKPEDIKKQRDDFVKEYLSIDNQGGIGAIDAKAEFIPLDSKPILVDDRQMALIKQKVYDYFGVSEAIVTSNFTEEQWNSFYESVLEPIALQMSLEFTAKLFTEREIGFGNEIVFESNRLQYASAKDKTELLRQLMPFGILTINEAREILNMAPVDKGDVRLQSLNYINIARAEEYQLQGNNNEGGEDSAGNTETQNGNE